jgi:uncharacterized lipoprotein YmbA
MRTAGVVAVVLLVGCASSAPLRFYTLSEVPPAGAATAPPGMPAIRVGRVKIPAELDRNELVQRIDANRVHIGELDRWAAPLDEMIRRVLSANLLARTNTQSTPGNAQPATLTLDIDELMGDTTCAVSLSASWELKGATPRAAGTATNGTTSGSDSGSNSGSAAASPEPTPPPAHSGREVIRVLASSDSACSISALPQRMSQALAELSERILAARR